ncbi:MAG: hypothetical protein ABIG93_05355 [archaeon]
MRKRNLGIIGKGKLITHFLRTLTVGYNGDTKREKISKELKLDVLVNVFFDNVGNLVLYNHGYKNSDFFAESLFKGYNFYWEKNSEKEVENLLPKLFESGKISVEDDFDTFFSSCDIILDASGGHRPESLLSYAKELDQIIQGKNLADIEKPESFHKDFQTYLANSKVKKKEGRVMSEDEGEFANDWNLSLNILELFYEISKDSPIGGRTLWRSPFSIPLMIERGKQIREAIDSTARTILPTYINAVNEVCTTSNVLVSICPELQGSLIGLTGFDLDRLEKIVNDKFAGDKKRLGISNYNIQLDSVLGIHDRSSMLPVIRSSSSEGSENLRRILKRSDYKKLNTLISAELGKYYDNYHNEKGQDVNLEVDKNILETVINAAKSFNKGLTINPRVDERPLNNSYFQKMFNDGSGLFLSGKHSFVNGKVVPIKTDLNSHEKRWLEEKVINFNCKLFNLVNDEEKISLSFPSKFTMGNKRVNSYSNENKNIILSIGRKVFDLDLGTEEINHLNQLHKFNNYSHLDTLDVNGITYLVAGYNDGFKFINIKNPEEKLLTVQLNQRCVRNNFFKDFNVINDSNGYPDFLATSHSDIGVIKIDFDNIYSRTSFIKIDHTDRNYFILKKEFDDYEELECASSQNRLYVGKGNKLSIFNINSSDNLKIMDKIKLNDKINSVATDNENNLYLSTTSGKLYLKPFSEKVLREIYSGASSITDLKTSEIKGTEGVLFRTQSNGNLEKLIFVSKNGEDKEIYHGNFTSYHSDGTNIYVPKRLRLEILDLNGDIVKIINLKEKTSSSRPIKCLTTYGGI